MDTLLIKLGQYFGIGVVTAGVFGVIWKLFLQSVVKDYLNHKLKLKEQEQKASLDNQLKVLELQTKSAYDTQDKFLSKRLELEAVKLNRVFPYLEEINLLLSNYRMMHSTYIHSVINNAGLRDKFEESRLKIDEEIIDKIHKVSIYLPQPMTVVLQKLRKVISCSWKDPQVIHAIIFENNLNKREVARKDGEILTNYHNCFLDMVSKYCSITNDEINYVDILNNFGFDQKGEYTHRDIMTRFVEAFILFHEYTDSAEHLEILTLLERE